jgi:nucleosome assembly protein 1-like 1
MADPEKQMVVDGSDHEDVTSDEEAGDVKKNAAVSLLQDPNVMAALQGKLSTMIGTNSGYIQSLPAPVKKRLKALKKIQFEATKIEAQFYEEVHQLECKYHTKLEPLYSKRVNITKGTHEPTEDECEWPSESEDEEEQTLAKEVNEKAKLEEEKKKEEEEKDVKGVPQFWLTIFKNVEMIADMVQEADEPALETLYDVTVTFTEKNPMGFTLYFHFSPNDYFNNEVLTKTYELKCEPQEDDPFAFEGPEIIKCTGSTIDWKKGKNLTVKQVKKKQKHKSKGSIRTITKQVKADSFFNFFDPPIVPDDPNAEVDEDTQALLTVDFEIGHYIRERIVPRAVLFFTGEALDDESDYDEEDEDEDDDDEDGSGSENDADFDPKKAQANPECKQQ